MRSLIVNQRSQSVTASLTVQPTTGTDMLFARREQPFVNSPDTGAVDAGKTIFVFVGRH